MAGALALALAAGCAGAEKPKAEGGYTATFFSARGEWIMSADFAGRPWLKNDGRRALLSGTGIAGESVQISIAPSWGCVIEPSPIAEGPGEADL